MFTCQQMTELVTDYLEGRLTLIERMSFQMHIGMCSRCRAYLRQMKMTVRTLGKLPVDPIPADMRNELLARFRNTRPKSADGAVSVPWALGWLAAVEKAIGSRRGWAIAGLLVAAVVGGLLASGMRQGPIGEATCCLLIELGAGGVLVAFLATLTATKRAQLSSATFAVTAMVGSLVGFGMLHATCPMAHVLPHALLFHAGGIVLAGVLGLAVSRCPAFR